MFNCKCSICSNSYYNNLSVCPVCYSNISFLFFENKDIFCKSHLLHFYNRIIIYFSNNGSHYKTDLFPNNTVISIYNQSSYTYKRLVTLKGIVPANYIIKHINSIINFSWNSLPRPIALSVINCSPNAPLMI